MADYTINILHLFPDLLNLYGDRGNIQTLCKRLEWRGVDVNVKTVTSDDVVELSDTDIIVLGGGGDREMELEAAIKEVICSIILDKIVQK